MRIVFDSAKRDRILAERGLDLGDAGRIFEGFHLTRRDDAHSDVEERFVTVGMLDDEIVLVVWTVRDSDRRIVTMWKCNERERQAYVRRRDGQ